MNYRRFIFSFIIFSTSFFFYPNFSQASTFVIDDITQDTTWTLDQSPYLIEASINIFSGATLTIEPGVIVKFNAGGVNVLGGSIKAVGTDAEPIYFTSYYDDEVAPEVDDEEFCYEDFDEDLNSLGEVCETFDWGDPQVGDWDGFYLQNSTNSSFENVFFKYAKDSLVFNSSSVDFKNLSIKNSQSGIVSYNYSNININNGTFDNLREAFTVYNDSLLNIDNGSLSNAKDGFSIFNNASLVLSDFFLECENDGIVAYNHSLLNMSASTVACGHDGVSIFDGVKATLDRVKISQAQDVGVIAFDQEGSGLLNQITINKSEIIENKYGFVVFGTAISAHQNNIHDNTSGVLVFSPLAPNQFDFTNNWWGDASGPHNTIANSEGKGEEISDDVLFIPFCKVDCSAVRNPVIIVPGLLGTEISKPTADEPEKLWLDLGRNFSDIGDQFMDALQFKSDLTPSDTSLVLGGVIRKKIADIKVAEPVIFDYSGSLLEEFTNQSYIEDTDLFLFSYDWRFGVSADNVNKLKQKITEVLEQTGSEKVDIVAHSMGGLITKKYVVDNPTEHHIDKAIFVGVPNTGSVKAVKNLLTGDGNVLTSDKEMQKLSVNMPAAYDLLPSEEYFNKKGSYMQTIDLKDSEYIYKNLNFNEVKSFLAVEHGLNVQAVINAHHLHTSEFDNYDLRTTGINLYAINGCKAGTLSKIKELRVQNPLHKSIVNVRYVTPEEAPGDGTVSLESATNLPINQTHKFFALKGTHAEMLSSGGVRQQIVNILSGSTLSTKNDDAEEIITQDIDKCELNGKAISIYSPLSIDIVDQDGNHAGLSEDGVSIENNIPNADFQIMGDHKFVYLPTDDGQTYNINVIGTGTGTFTLTDATISANNIIGMQVFRNISVTPSLLGHLNISDNTTLELDDNGDETIDRTLSPTFILSGEEALDFIPASEIVDETPDKNNSSGSRVSGSSVNKQDLILPVEIVDSSIVIMENPIKNTVVKQQEEHQKVVQVESMRKDNLLTANVANTDTAVDYRVIIISLFGVLGLLVLAQNLNKR